jgi:hypothetical protein
MCVFISILRSVVNCSLGEFKVSVNSALYTQSLIIPFDFSENSAGTERTRST